MSFILDALRKSENARQRHGGPTLAEVPIARRKESRPWWIAVVAALLTANVLVLLYVLTRGPEPSPPQVAVPAVTAPAPAAAVPPPVVAPPAPAAAPVAAAPAVAIPVQPAPVAVPVIPPAAAVVAGRSLAEEAAATAVQPGDPDAPSRAVAAAANVPDREPIVRSLTPGAPAGTSQTTGEENLPTLNELTGERATDLPAMHLDIHVYSTNPAERFVFINNRKYTEGDMLQEGPVVERIRADGVVLNQRGFRFILPRQ